MIKSGICVKKEKYISKVHLIVDASNFDCVEFFTTSMVMPNDEQLKIEMGDFVTKTDDDTIIIYNKDCKLKNEFELSKTTTLLKSDKNGQYFETIVFEKDEYEFTLFEKDQFELLQKFFQSKLFETEDKIYYLDKKKKGIGDFFKNIVAPKSINFYTQKQFKESFSIVESTETNV